MNAEQLLAHYEKISDAPDAVPRLRRFILELAIRGKLVDQDSNDEPAPKSLEQMAGEKARLVRMKISKSRRRRKSRSATHSSLPFDLPIGWSPVRIEQILIQLQTGAVRKLTPPERLPVGWCSRNSTLRPFKMAELFQSVRWPWDRLHWHASLRSSSRPMT